jgi:hypothetical protein
MVGNLIFDADSFVYDSTGVWVSMVGWTAMALSISGVFKQNASNALMITSLILMDERMDQMDAIENKISTELNFIQDDQVIYQLSLAVNDKIDMGRDQSKSNMLITLEEEEIDDILSLSDQVYTEEQMQQINQYFL